ncbi:hypothetical protein EDC01DRAFT_609223 [Geopyxis carbonaria]|nr:hypothetical protein EDC01DRAFT_609223 [Geopyxis carbonaria]
MLCRPIQRLLPPLILSAPSAQPIPPTPRRLYATHTATPTPDPYRWPTTRYPTPYDILDLSPKAPYTKTRYVELVKLYHPDHAHRHHHPHHHTPHQTRLDRFRLVVAANTILSDPSKRRDYDAHGLGWPHSPRPAVPPGVNANWWQQREGHSPPQGFRPGPFSSAYGTGGPHDASRNATWEDWEQWRLRTAGTQQPVYTNNGAFVLIVLFLATVGGFAEVGYAKNVGNGMVEVGQKQTVDIGRDLQRRRREAMESGDRDERVRRFLMVRDPGAMGGVGRGGAGGGMTEGVRMLPAPQTASAQERQRKEG